jgi:hypothetical protein
LIQAAAMLPVPVFHFQAVFSNYNPQYSGFSGFHVQWCLFGHNRRLFAFCLVGDVPLC